MCDARPVFATKSRFPDAHEVVVNWPHRYLKEEAAAGRIDGRTVVTVLTHDPKFDVPVLVEALQMDLAYLGAMGSRKIHKDREARLREAGVTDEQLTKIASPIGLDLGARTPEETTASISAEIISLRWGGGATRLTALDQGRDGRAAVAAWASVSVINLLIWAIVSMARMEWAYPWWVWVAGPWGAVLLAGWIGERAGAPRPPR